MGVILLAFRIKCAHEKCGVEMYLVSDKEYVVQDIDSNIQKKYFD